jgi:Putative prokaryotic signal transducing protein
VYCPQCGGEYREGFFTCADCGGALVEEAPPLPELVDTDLVTVLESGDPNEIAFAEAVLSDAGIPFMKAGESLQDLFALGRVGFGFSPIAGPVTFQVREEHAEAAARILEEAVPEALEASDLEEAPE